MRAEPGPPFTNTAGLARHYLTGLRVRCGSQGVPCTLTFVCLFLPFILQLKLDIVVHAVVQISCLFTLLRVLDEEVLALAQISVSVVVGGLASGYSARGQWFSLGDAKQRYLVEVRALPVECSPPICECSPDQNRSTVNKLQLFIND